MVLTLNSRRGVSALRNVLLTPSGGDDTAAISAAFTQAAATGAAVFFSPGTYISGQINWEGLATPHTIWAVPGTVTITQAASYTSGFALWRFGGSQQATKTTLTGNVTKGDTTVSVATAALAADDLIMLADESVPYATQATRFRGQLVPVQSITSGAALVIQEQAYSDLTSTPFLRKITALRGFTLTGLSFANTFATSTAAFLYVTNARDVTLDFAGNGCGGPGAKLLYVYNFNVTTHAVSYYDNSITGLQQFGYGVELGAGCALGVVNVQAEQVRHAFSAGGTDGEYGEPQGIQVTGVARGCTSGGWDVHAQGNDITLANVKAYGCLSYGVQIRANNCHVSDAEIKNCTGGLWLTENPGKNRFRNIRIDTVIETGDVSGSPGHGVNIAAACDDVTLDRVEVSNVTRCAFRFSSVVITNLRLLECRAKNWGLSDIAGDRAGFRPLGALSGALMRNIYATWDSATSMGVNRPFIYGQTSGSGNTLLDPRFEAGVIAFQNSTVSGFWQDDYKVVASATTLAIDSGAAVRQKITMGTNITTFSITNGYPGRRIELEFVQDGTGSRLLTVPATVKPAGGALTLTTTASKRDRVMFQYSEDGNWYEVARSMNL